MASDDLIGESQDPSTSAARLAELAQVDRALWPAIAVHPAAYPALLDWLGQQGDPTVNAVLALRAGSAAAAPTPAGPPPPPAGPSTAYAPAAHGSVPSGSAQTSSPSGSAGDNAKNVWFVAGMVAVVLVLIGGIAFGATQVFGGDDDDKDEASSSRTVDAPELSDAPTAGSTGDAFCEKFKEAQDAIAGSPGATSAPETARTIADIFGDIEAMSPAEVKGDIGIMADYFETMSDPSTLDTSTISERVKTFTEAGKRVSTYYSSNCM